ncbi:MAG TPA: acetate--CoA ligase family protein [Burkholderiales bacterium]|nr:acetate--CoA ligase family protein [Burkholderiales bacterium]
MTDKQHPASFWSPEQMQSIHKMLHPRSIAVVGATPKGGYGGRLLNAVLRSRDRVRVYPVNPNYEKIAGVRAYPSITSLPEAPDLVGIVVPHAKVLGVLHDCHEKRAGSAVIISAGFAERGTDAGAELQAQVGRYARESGMRIAGPNCLGVANVRDNIWATASSRTLDGLTGHIGLVCQSGATAFGPFLQRAVDSGIGLSHIISTGNETDLDFADFARYLVDDPGTRVIAGFVEGFKDVRKVIAVARLAAERSKPIVLIKIGRSASGSQAARSHTAALTGTDELYEALFRQYGIIRVKDYDELLETAQLLARSRKPKKAGVAVVSHSGGISSLTADMLGVSGLSLPPLTDRARDGINAILKESGWAANPSDVTGFARREEFTPIMDYMIEEPEVGALVIASAGAGTQVEQVVALRDRTDKNVAFFWTASRYDDKALPALKAANVPLFYSPETLARGLKNLIGYHAWRDARPAESALPARTRAQDAVRDRLAASTHATLSEKESKDAVAAWDIPVTNQVLAATADDAVAAAGRIGYPVALKVDSPDIPHKTEAGVVRLSLQNAATVRAAYEEIVANARRNVPDARISGVLVQEMVEGGVEVIVGVKRDPQMGPMLLFGTGGVMVEIYNDVSLRHCPITRTEALAMIAEVKGARLLKGYRGKPACDIDALAGVLVSVSQMAVHLDDVLAELDINPLMVLPGGRGVKAADALLVVRKSSE